LLCNREWQGDARGLVGGGVGRRQQDLVVAGLEVGQAGAVLVKDSTEFRALDIEDDPLPDLDRRFDLAICTEVLEHLSPAASEKGGEMAV
jgi:hypothetical protein